LGVQLIGIEFQHVVANINPEPPTKDPFDRLLLGVCAAEKLQLVTMDRALSGHPLAWRDIPLKNK
jgi:PIN domain nuclease of toxin-antitoxin system